MINSSVATLGTMKVNWILIWLIDWSSYLYRNTEEPNFDLKLSSHGAPKVRKTGNVRRLVVYLMKTCVIYGINPLYIWCDTQNDLSIWTIHISAGATHNLFALPLISGLSKSNREFDYVSKLNLVLNLLTKYSGVTDFLVFSLCICRDSIPKFCYQRSNNVR